MEYRKVNNNKSKKTIILGINSSVSGMFAQYFNSCYPNGCDQDQHDAIKQAFYSGIFSYMAFILSDKMPKDITEAANKMDSILEECLKVLKARLE